MNLPWRVERDISEIVFQWWIQGSPPLIFFYQTEARRPEKIFFGDSPPPLYLRVWMTIPHTPYLKVWIQHWIQLMCHFKLR